MSTVSVSVVPFNGTNIDWLPYLVRLRDRASTICRSLTPYGLVPRMYQANDPFLQQLPGLIVPVIWPQAPGPAPIFDPNFTVPEVGRYNAAMTDHKMTRDDYQLLQDGDSLLKTIILQTLPAVSLHHLSDPTHGTTFLSIADIIDRGNARYGTLNADDLKINKLQTETIFESNMDIRAYTAQHAIAHSTAQANGQPFPEQDKVTALIKGITACGLFTHNLNNWLNNHAVNQQTFAGLETSVHQWFSNLSSVTLAQHNYSAAAVTALHPPPALQTAPTLSPTDIAAIAAAVTSTIQLTNRPPRNPHRPAPTHRATAHVARPPGNLYCWSHGLRYHNGQQCKYPKPGHQANATANNRMGGNPN